MVFFFFWRHDWWYSYYMEVFGVSHDSVTVLLVIKRRQHFVHWDIDYRYIIQTNTMYTVYPDL